MTGEIYKTKQGTAYIVKEVHDDGVVILRGRDGIRSCTMEELAMEFEGVC
jgi:hypothetical protein